MNRRGDVPMLAVEGAKKAHLEHVMQHFLHEGIPFTYDGKLCVHTPHTHYANGEAIHEKLDKWKENVFPGITIKLVLLKKEENVS